MLRSLAALSFLIATAAAQTNFPPPPTPASNPHTPGKEMLGMTLFFEEQLSSTGTVACATCHDFAHGGVDPRTATARNAGPDGHLFTADDQRGSPGIAVVLQNGTLWPTAGNGFGPRITGRRAPTVINSGYHTHLTYDGSKTSLEQLVPGPLVNTVEMGHISRTWNDVTTRVTNSVPLVFASNLPPRLQNFVAGQTYPALFQAAFGSPGVTQQRIVDSIACYLRTLNSDQSKWDQVLHQQATLTAQEQQGLNLFNSTANGAVACKACHGDFENRVLQEGPIAGAMTTQLTGYFGSLTPTRLVFHNTGVRPLAEDLGRQNVTQSSADAASFRVASLRNVELTAPYFHNGSAATLADAVQLYNRGGDFHANQAPNTGPRNYTQAEVDALVALLRTLTDQRIAMGVQPFDRPLLGSQNGAFVSSLGQGDTTATGTLIASSPWAPRLGESWFRLGLTGATPGVPTFLMWDTAANIGSHALWNVQLALTPDFQVLTTGLAEPWLGVAVGTVQAPLPLPNTPSLSGQVFFAQWLVLEASQNWPAATSNVLRIPLR
jgi:cytochrome c peroxidase